MRREMGVRNDKIVLCMKFNNSNNQKTETKCGLSVLKHLTSAFVLLNIFLTKAILSVKIIEFCVQT